MNKKSKIVLAVLFSLFALILIGAVIGTAALLFSGNAHGVVGELLNEFRKTQELKQIEQQWESTVQNENGELAKIVIVSGVVQPVYSSTIQPSHNINLDEKEQIDAVIKILSEPDVIWEHPPKDSEESTSLYESHYGMQFLRVV